MSMQQCQFCYAYYTPPKFYRSPSQSCDRCWLEINAMVRPESTWLKEEVSETVKTDTTWNVAYESVKTALANILEIGKRDMSNPKYDSYFDEARAALAKLEAKQGSITLRKARGISLQAHNDFEEGLRNDRIKEGSKMKTYPHGCDADHEYEEIAEAQRLAHEEGECKPPCDDCEAEASDRRDKENE